MNNNIIKFQNVQKRGEYSQRGGTPLGGVSFVEHARQNTRSKDAPLGIYTVNCAPPENKGLQSTEDSKEFSKDDHLLNKYAMHSAAVEMLYQKGLPKQHRITSCLTKVNTEVEVHKAKDHDSCHYGGLYVCGNAWGCPICAPKISEKRKEEIKQALEAHKANGGKVLLVTKTFAHDRYDDLGQMIDRVAVANNAFFKTKPVVKMKSALGFTGYIRTLEITHGNANGWHPHYHELWLINTDEPEEELCPRLKTEIFKHWERVTVRQGLGRPSEEHGVDVRNGDFAAEYVSKWGHEPTKPLWTSDNEMTKTHIKKSKGNSSNTFDFIRDYLETGNTRSKMLYREFLEATYRKRQLSWSRGLKKSFGIVDKSDEELAEEQDEFATLLGRISFKDWQLILKSKGRGNVLVLAKNGGWSAVQRYIKSLQKSAL